ncbi:MAG: hypothetical protein ACOYBJ_01790 [Patescibacteria group bacterium]|jgi:hypothetical protein
MLHYQLALQSESFWAAVADSQRTVLQFGRLTDIVLEQLAGLEAQESYEREIVYPFDALAIVLHGERPDAAEWVERASAEGVNRLEFGLRAYGLHEPLRRGLPLYVLARPFQWEWVLRELSAEGIDHHNLFRVEKGAEEHLRGHLDRLMGQFVRDKVQRPVIVVSDLQYFRATNLMHGCFAALCREHGIQPRFLLAPWATAGHATESVLHAEAAKLALDLERGLGRWPD